MKTSSRSFRSLLLLVASVSLLAANTARADETIRRAQQALHDQGFYYGSIDGVSGDETTQAVRRFQIRNGLAVTGQLNDETLRALQLGGASASRPGASTAAPRNPSAGPPPVISGRQERGSSANPDATPPPLTSPPPIIRRESRPPPAPPPAAVPPSSGPNYSRPDLRAQPPPAVGDEPPPPARSTLPPNAVAPSLSLQQFFVGTPFEFAPPPVQSEIVRRAQLALRREGLYRGEADGVPGPVTAAAIAEFQALNGQRRTGRLDFQTLRQLRLSPAPGRRATPQPFYSDEFDDDREDADLRRFRQYRPRRNGTVYEGRIVD